jgi:tubulin-specific chaperone C
MGKLENISNVGGERVDAIEHCLAGIARLQKEAQDASSYIPAYDQKIYSEVSY